MCLAYLNKYETTYEISSQKHNKSLFKQRQWKTLRIQSWQLRFMLELIGMLVKTFWFELTIEGNIVAYQIRKLVNFKV